MCTKNAVSYYEIIISNIGDKVKKREHGFVACKQCIVLLLRDSKVLTVEKIKLILNINTDKTYFR